MASPSEKEYTEKDVEDIIKIQAIQRGRRDRNRVEEKKTLAQKGEKTLKEEEEAAIKIQAVARGRAVRREKEMKEKEEAATKIQAQVRGRAARKEKERLKRLAEEAVPPLPSKFHSLESNLETDLNNYYDSVAKQDEINRMIEDGEDPAAIGEMGVDIGFNISDNSKKKFNHTARVVARITSISEPSKAENMALLNVLAAYKGGLQKLVKQYGVRDDRDELLLPEPKFLSMLTDLAIAPMFDPPPSTRRDGPQTPRAPLPDYPYGISQQGASQVFGSVLETYDDAISYHEFVEALIRVATTCYHNELQRDRKTPKGPPDTAQITSNFFKRLKLQKNLEVQVPPKPEKASKAKKEKKPKMKNGRLQGKATMLAQDLDSAVEKMYHADEPGNAPARDVPLFPRPSPLSVDGSLDYLQPMKPRLTVEIMSDGFSPINMRSPNNRGQKSQRSEPMSPQNDRKADKMRSPAGGGYAMLYADDFPDDPTEKFKLERQIHSSPTNGSRRPQGVLKGNKKAPKSKGQPKSKARAKEREKALEKELANLNQRLFHNLSSLAIQHQVQFSGGLGSPAVRRKGGNKPLPAPTQGSGVRKGVPNRNGAKSISPKRGMRVKTNKNQAKNQANKKLVDRAAQIAKKEEAARRAREARAVEQVDKRAQRFGVKVT